MYIGGPDITRSNYQLKGLAAKLQACDRRAGFVSNVEDILPSQNKAVNSVRALSKAFPQNAKPGTFDSIDARSRPRSSMLSPLHLNLSSGALLLSQE
ncbi:hypothetical protein Tdes44962_MAKER09282 [Teratosphaeria destructans]|uniref:Uncharacterized protein n=1 Tax=Teratosphaeria destructans TaxID=418781 RepID=A0A9W7SUD0_9PEZI|nr:hypothetical protein Tdes44962_MAKER09282 [Teratosphaeria destructans]